MKIDVMGLKFDSMTMDEALSRAEALLRGDKAAYVVTPNAEIAYEALHDVQLREMLNGADLMLPDGAGVVLASKLLRTPVKQKVAGVDFAAGLLGILERNGQSLYLLGGKTGIGELAAQKMLEAHPPLRIAGRADGSFQDAVQRAPAWMIRLNLEWLYRLIREPKRFRRMLRLPKYLWAVMLKRIRGT